MQINSSSKVEPSIRVEYEKRYELFEKLERNVLKLIECACKKQKWIFVHRVKTLESYALKLLTGRTNQYEIDDFLACTVVVPNLSNIETAKVLVKRCFDVVSEKPDEYVKSRPTEFDFDGIRLRCSLKEGVKKTNTAKLHFEIQVKTLLEYAWSEATHDFSYKGDNVSWAKERLAAQLKATLNGIDLSIFNMDSISASPFLNKKNKGYEELAEVLKFLKVTFVEQHRIPIPTDIKRLAKEVVRFLKRTKLTLADLDTALQADTALGRGYKTRHLSVYSIILVAVFAHQTVKITTALNAKPGYKESTNIVIPSEIMIQSSYQTSKFKKVVFL